MANMLGLLSSQNFKSKIKNYIAYSRHVKKITNVSLGSNCENRAALSYLTSPFLNGFGRNLPNENNIKNILGVLIELGYTVDIFDHDCDINKYYAGESYDLVLGFGDFFGKLTERCLKANPGLRTISYFTELEADYTKGIEIERYKELKRAGVRVTTQNLRSSDFYEVKHHAYSNRLIFTGPSRSLNFFDKYPFQKKVAIQPSIVELAPFLNGISRSPKKFCWVGSFGGILKGLDILVEAFRSRPDLELILFGVHPRDQVLFKNNLPSNIMNRGFVDMASPEARDEMQTCSYVLCPSFSEGSSTGVLTAMGHGCIPIVSKYAGTEVTDTPLFLIEELSSIGISKTIDDAMLSIQEIGDLENTHLKIATDARLKYSADSFRSRFRCALLECLQEINLDHEFS